MYSMALVMKVILGWDIHFSIWVSSLTVGGLRGAGRPALGHLQRSSAVLPDLAGRLLIPILGLIEAGGWSGMMAAHRAELPRPGLHASVAHARVASPTIPWAFTGPASCSAWARSSRSATGRPTSWSCSAYWPPRTCGRRKMAPDHRRGFKMMVPFIVILPGLLGLAVLPMKLVAESQAVATGGHSYNEVLPLMLARYLRARPAGLGRHGADRRIHVRHGGQRQRLRHGLDLRHLPAAYSARRHRRSTT